MKYLRIGSRKSKLALYQTQLVADRIRVNYPEYEISIIPMNTGGDENLDKSLLEIGGKGVFTKELEDAICNGEIDMAVHSAKDLPMENRDGIAIYPVLEREERGDILIKRQDMPFSDMKNPTVGTGSLRRAIQIKNLNPSVSIKDLRGNVHTRIEKLRNEEYDGIILASAGINRVIKKQGIAFLEGLSVEKLSIKTFLPAAAQGILALETREGEYSDIVHCLSDRKTSVEFETEREFLRLMGAGCNAPLGVSSEYDGDMVKLSLMYGKYNEVPIFSQYRFLQSEMKEQIQKIVDDLKREMI